MKRYIFLLCALIQTSVAIAGVTITITSDCLPTTGVAAASSVVSILSNEISVFENIVFSQIEALSTLDTLCTATTVGTQSTISTAGIYCLSADVSGLITISASNVTFNLNGHTITGGIAISSNVTNAVIYNGNIKVGSSGSGILIQSGCSAIEVNGVEITGATYGIQATNATNCIIKNCFVRENSYGVYCSSCSGMQIQNTQADSNTNVGFDLVSSSSNVLTDCAALATGKGNTTIINNIVTGFSSSNGYGNIFERCIANGTQALSTTDSSSVIAGFALRGTEGCSKIINSESANAITSSSGVTIPYGILLQGSFNGLSTVTGYFALSSGDINTAKWSPDGQYLAVVGNDMTIGLGNDLQILSFNRVSESLTPVAGFFTTAENVNTVSWSPDGQYLAVGGSGLTSGLGEQLQIFQFNRMNNTLQVVAGYFGSSALINWVDWSSDGQYLVVGCPFTYPGMQVFSFNKITNTLTMVAGAINTGNVFTTSWSPDGQYVAIGGGDITDGYGTQLQIFQFNRSNNSLTVVAGNLGGNINAISWSPDGQYLAIGGGAFGVYDFQIFQFNRLNNNLIPLAGAVYDPTNQYFCLSVSWSSDGQYVAIGTDDSSLGMAVYSFNQSTQMLSLVANSLIIASGNWSPDGQYLAIVDFSANNNKLQIFTGLQFPSQNVITGNTVYCNGQSVTATFTGAVGVGISGSSISNMIIGNTAYNNPPVSSNFFVPSNYYFCTNVFNQLFGEAPTELQNISLNGNTPITQFTDPVVIAQQIYADLTATSGLLTYLPILQNQLSLANACSPQTLSVAGTISQPGTYCLSNAITGTIIIAANDVALSLNNYKVVGSIVVNSNQTDVTIENGVVDANGGTNGILVNSGASNITISNMTVKNATLGVQFNSVAEATVQSCTFLSNTTGMQLQSSSNVAVFSSNAVHNKNAGFDLLSSATNSFFDCQALATGQGNTTKINNFVAGFTSYNGYGNIFERCIANGTQALSTTDSSSIVAGFALRGTEGCTKIINSESANAITSSSGVTIPYGILLQGSVSAISAVTGIFSSGIVYSVNWSPDGQYIALGGNGLTGGFGTNNQFQIFQFNRVVGSITAVAGTIASGSSTILSVNWSPDGQYVAIGGLSITAGLGTQLQVFQFNRTNNILTPVAGTLGGTIESVNWSYDGQYLAIGGSSITGGFGPNDKMQIFQFNRVANALTSIAGVQRASVFSVNWSPDGQYVAVGGSVGVGGLNQVEVFQFNRSTNILAAVVVGPQAGGNIVGGTVNWSPDGQYLAVGQILEGTATSFSLQIFTFNRSTGVLTLIASKFPILGGGGSIYSVNWSSDGQYIVVGGGGLSGGFGSDSLQLFQFNRGTNTLTAVAGAFSSGNAESVNWSPDGQYLVVGGLSITGGLNTEFQIFTALQFPSQNVISGNTVYCNGQSVSSQFTSAVGVGISGSSIANMIIGNTAYDNPPVSSNFFVPSNYYFVTNVFNSLLGQAPSSIQNISLNGNTPITQVTDPVWLLQQLQADLYSITNVLATFNNAASVVCAPVPVTKVTTLSTAGIYCLSTNITGLITIAASNITLDLNGYTITGGIAVNSGVTNVTMKNGRVLNGNGGDGILVNAGAAQITVQDVRVKSATRGIHFTGVSNSYISNCQVSLNTTGIQLQSSSNIEIGDTIATQNVQAGFELLNSATCFVYGCKAAQTGTGNTNSSGSQSFVYGFVANGTVNTVFKDCIANNTKNTSATSWQTQIAGFALLGTGTQCNAIIGCESANGQTSSSGTSVPYGILLQGSTLSQVSTVTGTFSSASSSSGVYTCSWSPNGQYLAAGGAALTDGSGNQLQIFSFDRNSSTLTRLAGAVPTPSGQQVRVSKWSPNGQFLVTGSVEVAVGLFWVQVYRFYSQNNSLQLVAQAIQSSELTTGGALGIDWSPDGRFIAVGILVTVTGHTTGLAVLQFNDVTYQLSLFAGALVSTSGVQGYNASQWSPDGNYIVVSGTGFTNNVQIFQFNRSANTLTSVAAIATSGDGRSAIWSPDGNYITYGTTSGNNLYVYKFNKLTNQVTLAQTSGASGGQSWWNRWSPDGRYIATVGANYTNNGGNQFQVWQFDRSLNTLTYITGAVPTVTNSMQSVDWNPDGAYIAVGGLGLTSGTGTELQIYTGLSFPAGNVITNNTVYCNSMTFPSVVNPYGTGISGSSILNQIIQNDSFNNAANYVFAQNVFNPVYLGGPTLMQNDSVSQNVPVPQVQSINAALTRARLYLYSVVDSRL